MGPPLSCTEDNFCSWEAMAECMLCGTSDSHDKAGGWLSHSLSVYPCKWCTRGGQSCAWHLYLDQELWSCSHYFDTRASNLDRPFGSHISCLQQFLFCSRRTLLLLDSLESACCARWQCALGHDRRIVVSSATKTVECSLSLSQGIFELPRSRHHPWRPWTWSTESSQRTAWSSSP